MRKKLLLFWNRFGYMCVLSACMIMIASTAYFTRMPNLQVEAPQVTKYAVPTPTPSPRAVLADVITVLPTNTPMPFTMPCAGDVGMGFAQDTVIYNKTLGEYATHIGVDFLGDEGDAVRAAEGGTVSKVYEDDLMGYCIEIMHRDGYKSVYASLSSQGLVQVDDTVSCGQVIGTMGTSAIAECDEGAHLHFELWRLRILLNPINYLQEDR